MNSSVNMNAINVQQLEKAQQKNLQKEPVSNSSQQNTEIENGDKKSMDVLKWSGMIAAGALAVSGVLYAAKRGKGIDVSKLDFKDGKAFLKKNGKEYTGKVVQAVKNETDEVMGKIKTKYKDGVIQEVVEKTGDSKVIKYYKDGNFEKALAGGKEFKSLEELGGYYYEGVSDKAKKEFAAAKAQDIINKGKAAKAKREQAAKDFMETVRKNVEAKKASVNN